MRRRRPFWEVLSPGQAFVLFVSWCALGIIATLLMLVFFPWSIPFWVAALILGAYVMARVLGNIGSN